MRRKDEHIKLAEFYENRYRETRDIWDIIEASRHYLESANYDKAADIIIGIGEPLCRFGYIQKAKELHLQIVNKINGERKSTIMNNLANIYYIQGNYQSAFQWYKKSRKICEEIGHRAGLATTYNNIGLIHYAQGNYQEALTWCEKSVGIFKEIGSWHSVAVLLRNIALLYRDIGKKDIAKQYLKESYKIYTQLNPNFTDKIEFS